MTLVRSQAAVVLRCELFKPGQLLFIWQTLLFVEIQIHIAVHPADGGRTSTFRLKPYLWVKPAAPRRPAPVIGMPCRTP
ncbi:hypothetical protein, partial [Mycobacterium montefiorense]